MTKERFDRLYADDVLKKEYDQIIREVDSRFSDVVLLLFPDITKGNSYFVYGNWDYDSEGDEGEFDPDEYSEFIGVGGEYKIEEDHPLGDGSGWIKGIPTHYLWTSDEDILKDIHEKIKASKEKEELKKQTDQLKKKQKKELREAIIKSIESKLTTEELKYITFK